MHVSLRLLAVTMLMITSFWCFRGEAAGTWEMRICADPDNFPVSNQAGTGLQNRIAEILADELNAWISYQWAVINSASIRDYLRGGDCDLVLGIGDGAEGLLSTIPYYRTPYVFVSRADRGLDITSLDDPILDTLTVATYASGAANAAVHDAGLSGRLMTPDPAIDAGTGGWHASIVQAVVDGHADVGIVYGPYGGYAATIGSDALRVAPVTPVITATGHQMFHTRTIGVRPGDDALRDRLNLALASRWHDLQQVFADFGTPLMPLAVPQPGQRLEESALGVILPVGTADPLPRSMAAEAARDGALLAEMAMFSEEPSVDGRRMSLRFASAPTASSVRRAAERFVETEGVTAFVGGVGEDDARILADVAADAGVLFFNIGSTADDLRGARCPRSTFHIEASDSMYLDATVVHHMKRGNTRWFLIYERTARGNELFEAARRALRAAGGELVGAAAIPSQPSSYRELLDALRTAGADVVLTLLSPTIEEYFLAQYSSAGIETVITGMIEPVIQTREFYGRLASVAGTASREPRIVLWDALVATDGADELNATYMARFGRPMDAAGWASFAAVSIVAEAVLVAGRTTPRGITEFLEGEDAAFELHKGEALSFRRSDHQLLQPLYAIEIDPSAAWGPRASDQLKLVGSTTRVPTSRTSGAGQGAATAGGYHAGGSECGL